MNILIGENIKRLRKEKKITQEQLAEILNISPAAVSKWETNETYPDITLLFPLAHYFLVTIDELMGYDYLQTEKEIKEINKLISDTWIVENNWQKAKELTIKARKKYPNDYELMIKYLIFVTGGQAGNSTDLLINHKDEILKICDAILNGCNIENYRLEALTYKAKVLYALNDELGALEILNNFPSFYHTSNQKLEQLYPKGTKEFFKQLTSNLDELSSFTGNKLGKYIAYNHDLSNEDKITIVNEYIDLYNELCGKKEYLYLEKIISSTIFEAINRFDILGIEQKRLNKFIK